MTFNKSDFRLHRLSTMWDGIVRDFLQGARPWSEELQPWVDAYRGKSTSTRRVDDAIPEPFTGRLDRQPKAVLLALNPGNAFMGEERWMDRQLMPNLQGRNGGFSNEIRAGDGSYTTWAKQPLNWPALNGGSPHPFVTSRIRFSNDWLSPDIVNADQIVWFDLYPWHSKSWSSIDIRNPEVRRLIGLYVAEPIAALNAPTFAFGKAWFSVLPAIGFQKRMELGGPGTRLWENQTPSRYVGIFENVDNGTHVIAMRHSGAAGPPKQSEAESLRELVESIIAGFGK
jgi:hypothetical protein